MVELCIRSTILIRVDGCNKILIGVVLEAFRALDISLVSPRV